jgi:hypothetical protein
VTQFINQNSLLLMAVPATLVMLYFLLRPPGSRLKQILAVSLLAVLVVGYLLVRPGGQATSGEEAEALLLDHSRPTLLEVYSPY